MARNRPDNTKGHNVERDHAIDSGLKRLLKELNPELSKKNKDKYYTNRKKR